MVGTFSSISGGIVVEGDDRVAGVDGGTVAWVVAPVGDSVVVTPEFGRVSDGCADVPPTANAVPTKPITTAPLANTAIIAVRFV